MSIRVQRLYDINSDEQLNTISMEIEMERRYNIVNKKSIISLWYDTNC